MIDERGDWYSVKEIADMFAGMKADFADLRVEMQETKTLIRDYNGLRKEVADIKTLVATVLGAKKNLQWWLTFAVAVAAVVVAVVK